MSSQCGSWNVVIYSSFIWKEIIIDGECCLNWSMCHDFGLNFFYLWWNWINWWGSPFVISIGSIISISAVPFASWGWFWSTTWFVLSGCVMVTWSKWVGHAKIRCIIKPSCNDSSRFKMVPSSRWISTIASITTTYSTTCKKVFCWDSNLKSLIAGNANSVTHSLDSSKCPTWATCALISNLFNWFAVGPMCTRIELCRNLFKLFNVLLWES